MGEDEVAASLELSSPGWGTDKVYQRGLGERSGFLLCTGKGEAVLDGSADKCAC